MPAVTIQNVSKSFGDNTVLQNFSEVFHEVSLLPCWAPRAAAKPPCCA